MDLFAVSPLDIRSLMEEFSGDPAVLRLLSDLEEAICAGDELGQADAVAELSEYGVFQRGRA